FMQQSKAHCSLSNFWATMMVDCFYNFIQFFFTQCEIYCFWHSSSISHSRFFVYVFKVLSVNYLVDENSIKF
ncbi:MAG TPA: hypothetical protein DEH22_07610, partial [Chloroflexi bacterium]|nr:hypothetical protein [Chloroflexota bacterium]